MNAIIGFTGFIGSILKKHVPECDYFNSKNIESIKNKKFDTVYCSGISSLRFEGNNNPEEDLRKIIILLTHLKTVKCRKFIFISSITIHYEEDYGRNRKFAEDSIRCTFDDFKIVRLPSVFGSGLSKNLLYDILNDSLFSPVNTNQCNQWYCVDDLYSDIQNSENQILELYPEPISNETLLQLFDKNIPSTSSHVNNNAPILPCSGFIYSKSLVLYKLKKFIDDYS
jgi:hypothetical protein